MSKFIERWWQPALLLFLLLLISACREAPAEVPDTPSPEPSASAEVIEVRPSPTVKTEIISTPLPTVTFKGIEFAFDEAALGPLGATEHHPPIPPGSGAVQPEHLEIRLKAGDQSISPIIYVFPVQQYEAMSEEAAREIADLRALLAERPSEVLGDLPLLPLYEAVESYHSEPKYIDFRNGSGISFIAQVDHDHSLATDDSLFYTFQGLTEDNRFYVAAMVPISSSDNGENGQTPSPEQPDEETEHSAKAAASHGNWISIDLGEGHSLIDELMQSLHVQPDESFPAIKLPHFFTSQGMVLAYDEEISGSPTAAYGPALVENPDGAIAFLAGVPDMIVIRFQPDAAHETEAKLRIQPIRDEAGLFFEAIPEWQQEKSMALEQNNTILTDPDQPAAQIIGINFQNGSGFRGITAPSTARQDYIFNGVSEDGRYLVQFEYPLPDSMPHEEAISYLDSVVASLLVAPDASIGSSLPLNAADCENKAEFVEDVSIPDYTVVERGDLFIKIWRIRNNGTCTWTPAYKVNFSQGNPVEWHEMAIAKVVPPGEEIEVGVTVQSPAIPGIYQAWWKLTNENGQQFGDELGILFEAPRPATDIPGYGVIEGEINYPANGNPAVDIYFLNIENGERYVMRTEPGWTNYSNAVPVGTYHVFSRVAGDTSDSGGGYTAAVICGLHAGCNDHGLVDIVVKEGRANRDVNLFDWYAPAGSFPLPPPDTEQAATANNS